MHTEIGLFYVFFLKVMDVCRAALIIESQLMQHHACVPTVPLVLFCHFVELLYLNLKFRVILFFKSINFENYLI